jgi:hypothetical protein
MAKAKSNSRYGRKNTMLPLTTPTTVGREG